MTAMASYGPAHHKYATATPLPLRPSVVQFAPEHETNVYIDNPRTSWEEVTCTWYTSSEYSAFRQDCRACLRQLQQQQAHETSPVATVTQIMELLYTTVTQVDYVLDDAQVLVDKLNRASPNHNHKGKTLPPLTQRLFGQLYAPQHWIGLGLEYRYHGFLKEDALERRESLQTVVGDIQREYTYGLWTSNEVPEEFRESCLHFSQVSSLMAQFLAMAQYQATTA
eukprot:CAMPEP_0172439786 /NCGR_PEP_ID=MMETSP1065-20121228/659_1 /TAXON_ID=265537 /ORGANISM="Amphiprora paludosa, Strain CCMP125" /LENGTH=223 /DNA_ID=CAMNT_0013188519 /DNA_START=75 /DNA_END=749 /DNA_ORIENTATION=-